MLESIHEQMKLAWDNYYKAPRINWVLGWPGQVVLSISCMAWTYEVSECTKEALGGRILLSNSIISSFQETRTLFLQVQYIDCGLKGNSIKYLFWSNFRLNMLSKQMI